MEGLGSSMMCEGMINHWKKRRDIPRWMWIHSLESLVKEDRWALAQHRLVLSAR